MSNKKIKKVPLVIPEEVPYTIPLINTLISFHKNPDGDSLSSAAAIYHYLISNKKRAAIKFKGNIPKNLKWVIEDVEICNTLPEWAELVIILDAEPTEERIGWKIPDNMSVLNIDHHAYRIKDHKYLIYC